MSQMYVGDSEENQEVSEGWFIDLILMGCLFLFLRNVKSSDLDSNPGLDNSVLLRVLDCASRIVDLGGNRLGAPELEICQF